MLAVLAMLAVPVMLRVLKLRRIWVSKACSKQDACGLRTRQA